MPKNEILTLSFLIKAQIRGSAMQFNNGSHSKLTFEFTDFTFECGEKFESITLAYEVWGRLNENRSNAILIEHALTGTSHAASGESDMTEGWWEPFVGAGKLFDPAEYYIICANVPGGCSGSTGPSSINPKTGKPYGMSFPTVTVRDMARCQKRLIDYLGINKLLTVTGGSLGGMQALEWAAMYPCMVESIIPLATPGRAYPQSIAFRKAQRLAIMIDPAWNNGDFYNKSYPQAGIELARHIGVITYRSGREFQERFGRKHTDENYFDVNSRFEVESYLEYHGKKLAKWFDPNTYLYLSKAMDLHDLGYGRGSYHQGVRQITADVMMIGFSTDILFPAEQQREIYEILRIKNRNAYFKEIQTIYGHDAFLLEVEQISNTIEKFLHNVKKTKEEKHCEISD